MMNTAANLFCGQIASSRAHSLLSYPINMSHRSLLELLAIRLSPQAGKSLVMCGFLRFIPQRQIFRGIKNG